MYRYFIIYKPFQVLCQFSPAESKKTLRDFFDLPSTVYPVGRLDYDSEGLLILTDDPRLNKKLLDPAHAHEREYYVQVEGLVTQNDLEPLLTGVLISVDGKSYTTLPARSAKPISNPELPLRDPPIRFRKNIPDSWISLVLTEGKNRQVRKMTAAIGFPTLRLVRYRIASINISGWVPAQMEEMKESGIYQRLGLR